ncbi:MAG: NAD(P)-dependent alcohol dehydrogenase [Acidimicrobiia bacterium]
MRAAIADRYGSPDVIRFVDLPTPTPDSREVLVRIHATTVNRTDLGVLTGSPAIARLFYGLTKPKYPVLGNEFAGAVEAIGDDVTGFAVGDHVFGWDGARFGCHAEFKVVRQDRLIALMPAGFEFEQAAPGNEGACYAFSNLRFGGIEERGKRVLIYGATGAIGSAAVQLAAHFGAEVTAVCATNHVELVRGLGATHVFDYTIDALPPPGALYDIVFDAVGKTTYRTWKPAIVPGGAYVASDAGPGGRNLSLALWSRFVGDHRVAMALPAHSQEQVRFFRGLMEAGEFRPLHDRTYPFDGIVDAFRYVATGEKVGNVVISLEPPPGFGRASASKM